MHGPSVTIKDVRQTSVTFRRGGGELICFDLAEAEFDLLDDLKEVLGESYDVFLKVCLRDGTVFVLAGPLV